MLQWLIKTDKDLFLKINAGWTNSFLDSVFPWYRESVAWIPLYLFLIVLGVVNLGRKFWPWLLFVAITLLLTDQISSNLIKHAVQRVRPCNDISVAAQMRLLLNHCSGGFSFTSSHAANHFGFSMFLVMTWGGVIGKWRYAFLVWAFTVSYGQIYVGVHYPLDVLCGAIIGTVIGYFTAKLYNQRFGMLTINHVI